VTLIFSWLVTSGVVASIQAGAHPCGKAIRDYMSTLHLYNMDSGARLVTMTTDDDAQMGTSRVTFDRNQIIRNNPL